jgi:uncharacterized protein (DUF1684 family)
MLSAWQIFKIISAVTVLSILNGFFTQCERKISEQEAAYISEVEQWHQKRIKSLKSRTGWLSLAGLYWLKEGENSFGAADDNTIRFPAQRIPDYIGTFILDEDRIQVKINENVDVFHEGIKVQKIEMKPDVSGKPTILSLDSLSWYIIKRGERYGVRLRDSDNPNIKNFTGIERFEIDTLWRIPAKMDWYNPLKKIEVPDVLGMINESPSPGALVFEIEGEQYRLDPIGEANDKPLFLIFADLTNNDETYGAGRFLSVAAPDSNDKTFIDFNKAYNPPCTFTRFATCPLPPKQNVLPVRVTAGEKKYGDH